MLHLPTPSGFRRQTVSGAHPDCVVGPPAASPQEYVLPGRLSHPEPGGPPWRRPSRPEPARLRRGHFGGGGTRQTGPVVPSGAERIWKSPVPVMCTETAPAWPVSLPIGCALGVLPGACVYLM